ncbi:[Fe-Fe] hydrogenase large subunit C-terminal domain-containing protein [Pelotomaculum propionicicum]|uniref:[Fe-Fe] hydrogenase large subunit C-terminal domain-containing protein n=1 Tax=Pelotomaculum propionicicum TaxID=258475 RepID=UPI003B7F280E
MKLISTNEAKCRDCYKCIRSCPVKSICIKSGHSKAQLYAKVIEESCIQDGLCTTVCPQKAKVVVNHVDDVKQLLFENVVPVLASVAPSFPAMLPLSNPAVFPSLLKQLGFSHIGQTSVGAELICDEHRRVSPRGPLISSACPVVVNLVERHYPHLIPYLSPLVSPMVAHGRLLKSQFPGSAVVFIGPCIAKKGEALGGAVDYVLGFKEVWEWIGQEKIDVNKFSPSKFDGYQPGPARLFPIEGGQLRATSLSTDLTDKEVQTVTGISNCIKLFENFATAVPSRRPLFMELMACNGGCLGGPYGVSDKDIYAKKTVLLDYYSLQDTGTRDSMPQPPLPAADLYRSYLDRKAVVPQPTEEQIKAILALTDKFSPGDELNCGACGFNSCREKAVAVFQGNAESQMCIPYMRKRAESISNLVLRALPDGVIIFDEDLIIQEINLAAKKMFDCTRQVIGEKIDVLVNPSEFARVFQEMKTIKVDASKLFNGKITRQILFPLENSAVAIFTDITNELKQQEELLLVKTETIDRAQEVIKKQMTVAQVIAGLLGETTAETKVQLSRLIKLMKD